MPRQRDELFEALCEVCGWDYRDMTKTSRGRVNQALAELREVEASPQDVRACSRIYEALFEGAALTPQALVAHWPELKKRLRGQSLRYDPAASFAAAVEKADLPELPEGPAMPPEEMAAAIERLSESKSLPESQGWD